MKEKKINVTGKQVLKTVAKGLGMVAIVSGVGRAVLHVQMVRNFYKHIDLNGGH